MLNHRRITKNLSLYIPVWLNYQLPALAKLFGLITLYIPVWLNYQYNESGTKAKVKNLYIPVWLNYQRAYLVREDIQRQTLHSSMAKLSGFNTNKLTRPLASLHSSMAKLSDLLHIHQEPEITDFTFQYG